jgi:large subunit ribosomal protein L18
MISRASDIGDYTLVHVSSEHLRRYGWKGGPKNTPAAYLVGYLCGLQSVRDGVKEAILDIGRHAARRGARVFAALKGALDAGLKVPHDGEMLPSEDRIMGKHIAEYAARLKQDSSEEYQRRFSQYLARGLSPEKLEEHFMWVKNQIEKEAGGGDAAGN